MFSRVSPSWFCWPGCGGTVSSAAMWAAARAVGSDSNHIFNTSLAPCSQAIIAIISQTQSLCSISNLKEKSTFGAGSFPEPPILAQAPRTEFFIKRNPAKQEEFLYFSWPGLFLIWGRSFLISGMRILAVVRQAVHRHWGILPLQSDLHFAKCKTGGAGFHQGCPH